MTSRSSVMPEGPCARARAPWAYAWAAVISVGLVLGSAWAHAKPPPTTGGGAEAASAADETPTVDSEYTAGKEALRGGNPTGALDHFKAALKLASADERATWQMLLAIAVTYQRMDVPEFAIEYYRRFLKRSDEYRDALTVKWSNRRAMAVTDIEALETKTKTTHGYVSVVSNPPGAAIFIDDVQAGADQDAVTTFGMYLREGTYKITIKRAGYKDVSRTVDVARDKLMAVKADLESLTPTSAGAPSTNSGPNTLTATASPPSGDGPGVGPWVTMGVGGAFAVATVVFGALAGGARGEWEDTRAGYVPTRDPEVLAANYAHDRDLADKTAFYEATAGAMAGLTVAAVAGGLGWLLLDDSGAAPTTAEAPRLMIVPTSEGVHGLATWRF